MDGDAGLVPASGDGWLAGLSVAQSIVWGGLRCETVKDDGVYSSSVV